MCIVINFPRHKLIRCNGCGDGGCIICNANVNVCERCGGAARSLPTDCPGKLMAAYVSEDVHRGELDYKNGEGWVRRLSSMTTTLTFGEEK